MATQPQTGLTYQDLQAFPEDNLRRELIDGELIVTAAPLIRHQRVVARLVFRLFSYCEQHGGEVLPAPTDVLFSDTNVVESDVLKVDFAANVRSLGANVIEARTLEDFTEALERAKAADRTTVIVIETDPSVGVPSYETWWDVPVAEVSEMESVQEARRRYEQQLPRERYFL